MNSQRMLVKCYRACITRQIWLFDIGEIVSTGEMEGIRQPKGWDYGTRGESTVWLAWSTTYGFSLLTHQKRWRKRCSSGILQEARRPTREAREGCEARTQETKVSPRTECEERDPEEASQGRGRIRGRRASRYQPQLGSKGEELGEGCFFCRNHPPR